jgi:GNAT superfamily N-acetyltransferase
LKNSIARSGSSETDETFSLRLAREDDIPALEALIPLSVRGLQGTHYSPVQMEAALGPVFGVDRLLIRDGTYFVVEHAGEIVGCGGWSRRRAAFGGDRDRPGEDALLDRAQDPARIRAFFVHPGFARRGIGSAILQACEQALVAAGFREAIMVATLAGEPLYAAHGYVVLERLNLPLPNGMTLPGLRMGKRFDSR